MNLDNIFNQSANIGKKANQNASNFKESDYIGDKNQIKESLGIKSRKKY
ncbi:unnamed protein product [Paramecium pentaurelia]|uniref:Uncharacterized protein n=1 Tax=Paramecium pentaurelia TaxID=43138 RepID=A0A8S1YJH5_9CILI|nr:unnamed protein product [Paramecium pentaurelia]